MTLTQEEENMEQAFKDEMHLKLLQKSTEKLSWLNPSIETEDLFIKFTEEIGEVFVEGANPNGNSISLKRELIDVANLAMMLWSRL